MGLISKKELLQRTGISYGQLYRWKRERLIPEEWFIKRSSFTGQETFFPEEQILPRIESILSNKDRYSLSELSRMLSADIAPGVVEGTALGSVEEIAPEVMERARQEKSGEDWSLFELSLLAAVTEAGARLCIAPQALPELTELSLSTAGDGGLDAVLTVFFVGAEVHALMHGANTPLTFDREIQTAYSVSLRETAEMLKMNHRALFPDLKGV